MLGRKNEQKAGRTWGGSFLCWVKKKDYLQSGGGLATVILSWASGSYVRLNIYIYVGGQMTMVSLGGQIHLTQVGL